MRELFISILVAISALFILGYSVHMFIGGIVSRATEILAISVVCTIGAIIIVFMGIDIIKQRRKR